MNLQTGLALQLEIEEAWMQLENPSVTMDEAISKLEELGNEILEIDYTNRRVKVLQNAT